MYLLIQRFQVRVVMKVNINKSHKKWWEDCSCSLCMALNVPPTRIFCFDMTCWNFHLIPSTRLMTCCPSRHPCWLLPFLVLVDGTAFREEREGACPPMWVISIASPPLCFPESSYKILFQNASASSGTKVAVIAQNPCLAVLSSIGFSSASHLPGCKFLLSSLPSCCFFLSLASDLDLVGVTCDSTCHPCPHNHWQRLLSQEGFSLIRIGCSCQFTCCDHGRPAKEASSLAFVVADTGYRVSDTTFVARHIPGSNHMIVDSACSAHLASDHSHSAREAVCYAIAPPSSSHQFDFKQSASIPV